MKNGILRSVFFGLLGVFSLLLIGCGQDSADTKQQKKPTPKSDRQVGAQLLSRDLKMAVIFIEANVGNIQDGGGYQMWTASKMVDKLMKLHKPDNSNTGSQKSRISYVKDKVHKPWQVVLIPDDANKQIIVKAYGDNINKPVITKKIHISTY